MPELRPKPAPSSSRRPSGSLEQAPIPASAHERERKKGEKERKKAEKEGKKKGKSKDEPIAPTLPPSLAVPPAHTRPSSAPDLGPHAKLAKPRPHPHPHSHQHTPAHQAHPYQPSPSPSQLNNPAIYAAPPPRPVSTAPPTSMLMPMPEVQSLASYYPGTYPQQGQGRPVSYVQPSGKGPVSSLLEMWAKH